MPEKSGGEFLNIKYPDLQKSSQVQRSVDKKKRIEGIKTPNSPNNRNEVFLDRLENIFSNPDEDTKERNIELFKNKFLYPEVLVDKDNIPDSYFELQLKIARERGQAGDFGDIEKAEDIPISDRIETGKLLYKDQKESLDRWIDYLSDKNTNYPTWFKYYTLKSVLKLGNYDKENHTFKNRLKDTVGVFPELNRAALAKVNDILINKYGREYFELREEIATTESRLEIIDNYERRLTIAETGKDKDGRELHIKKKDLDKMKESLLNNPVSETNKDELKEKLTDLVDKQKQYLQLRNIPDKFTGIPEEEDFGKIYAYAIHEMTPASKENKENTDYDWATFEQNSDPTVLYDSLQHHGLEWCTAGGKETARRQLEGGNFYVCYTKDEKGLYTIPRIAIRMEKGQVAEVRGIEKDQNLEGSMTDIAKEKYHQLSGGEKFDKKDHDMKLLTLIDNKVKDNQVKDNQELTKDELKFLYEIDSKIEGFGYKEDPRIKEIKDKRDFKSDLAIVYDCSPNQVVNSVKKITEDTKVYMGDLDNRNVNLMNNRKNPLVIYGNADFENCTSLISIPKNIIFNGSAHFPGCTSLTSIPENTTFKEDAVFYRCTSLTSIAKNTTFKGDANFPNCTSLNSIAENTTFNRDVNFMGCTSLTSIAENITFNSFVNFNGCTSLISIAENATFNSIVNFIGCTSLTSVPENIIFNGEVDFRYCNLSKELVKQLKRMKKDGKIEGDLIL